ncbi:MAG: family 10 glycosylhydrolase [Bacteroidota bacterium]|nr:family 10 glycosylhydrolase [Bacteroidota bacterium]MDP4190365.1 family 10 glycosylhydrolase [Bacteroidota bacterium]MDP4193507.1 family 10 glycosylhydrolase [Bacteroidota bacterium]
MKLISKQLLKKLLLGVLILSATVSTNAANKKKEAEEIPSASRELRAAWVATVDNIDWPSKPGLSVDEQKKEAIAILDRLKELNMNAVIFQVRPQADALYKSDLEPWSYYLTGEQGKAPEPFYDPLEFWVSEAHARGIELHAWFNPYRANHPAMKCEISPKSIVKTKPECVRKLGKAGYYWMDPSLQEVQDHSFSVIMDVVKRYDIDGVQFDDYFYPYSEYNEGKDFPDDDTYKAYTDKGGKLSRGDWRRDNVNKFVKRVYDGIKKVKASVLFGISPFGLYRPGYPASIPSGFDQYSTLYADAKLWFNKGWVDYYSPQLYWNISNMKVSFPILLGWWNSENTKGRNLWPGLYSRPEVDQKTMSLEIVNQVMVTRGMIPQAPGTIIFSMKSIMDKDSLNGKALKDGPYKSQALVPSSPWLDNKAPEKPVINVTKNSEDIKVTWSPAGKEKPFVYVLYTKVNDKWNYEIFPEGTLEMTKKPGAKEKITAVAISAVDRCGNESKKNVFTIE